MAVNFPFPVVTVLFVTFHNEAWVLLNAPFLWIIIEYSVVIVIYFPTAMFSCGGDAS